MARCGSTSAPPPASARRSPCSTRGGAARERGTDVVVGFVETHGRALTAAQIRDLEVVPAPDRRVPGTAVRGDGPRRGARPRPEGRARRRARAHERAGMPQHQAVAGHRRAARGGHRRHLDRQHPASGVPQRRRRADHRDRPARDRSRRGRARGRADRARRHDPGGAAATHGPRQHLRGREGRRRAEPLLPRRQPRRIARAGPVVGRGPGRRLARGVPRTPRHHRALGDPRTGRRRADRCARVGSVSSAAAPAWRHARDAELVGVHVRSSDGLASPDDGLLERHRGAARRARRPVRGGHRRRPGGRARALRPSRERDPDPPGIVAPLPVGRAHQGLGDQPGDPRRRSDRRARHLGRRTVPAPRAADAVTGGRPPAPRSRAIDGDRVDLRARRHPAASCSR